MRPSGSNVTPPADVAAQAAEVRERVAGLRQRIAAAGGDPGRVTLVAVTKGFGVDAVRSGVRAGLLDLGENYVQELVAKAQALASDQTPGQTVRWHAIGHLQRNKVRQAAPHVAVWHSVDRLSVGAEIARRAPGAVVLIQVKATDEASKAGCAPDEVPALLDGLRDLRLDVRGLMTIGPLGPPEAARPVFRRVRALAEELGLRELSMGMSADLEIAVEEGATIVRVGRDLFGPRPRRAGMGH